MKRIEFDEIDSTNEYLKKEWINLPNFTFVASKSQKSGKGRNSRIWESQKDQNLLFSLLIKEESIINKYNLLSTYTAVIVAKVLEKNGLTNIAIKWPNDIYSNGKKICGILLEGQIPNYIVVGVGLNVNQKEFSNDLRHPATSMCLEANNTFDIEQIKNEIYDTIVTVFENLEAFCNEFSSYLAKNNYLKNKYIKVKQDNKYVVGKVISINLDNSLLIDNNIKQILINSGEIEPLYKAIIFDFDGTLVASTTIWSDIDKMFFAKRGTGIPEGYEQSIAHCGLPAAAKITHELYCPDEDPEDIIKEWDELAKDKYFYEVGLKERARELLERFKKEGVKIALATANTKSLYEPCMKRLGIDKYFDLIVDVDLLKCSKDSPNLYNYIAKEFNIEPKDILIFEDNSICLKTAIENGFISIGVDDIGSRYYEEQKKEFSHLYLYSLTDF